MKTLLAFWLLLVSAIVSANMVHVQTITFFDVQPGTAEIWSASFPEQTCIPQVMLTSQNPYLVPMVHEIGSSEISVSATNLGDAPMVGIVKVYYEPCE